MGFGVMAALRIYAHRHIQLTNKAQQVLRARHNDL